MLENRAVVTLAGEDRQAFLQGLISNDIHKCSPERAIWSALLTPQGKFLHEFSVVDAGDAFWLECEAARMMDLGQRLRRYQLRSNINLDIGRELSVFAVLDADPAVFGLEADRAGAATSFAGGIAFVDARLPEMGVRIIAPREAAEGAFAKVGLEKADVGDYEERRISLGMPEGGADMEPEKAILLENGFDELAGVDWNKGCFMGQELTARTKYRGLIKKRLLPVVTVEGGDLPAGEAILAEGKEVAQIRSARGRRGLALVRLDRWRQALAQGHSLTAGEQAVVVDVPDWVNLEANTGPEKN